MIQFFLSAALVLTIGTISTISPIMNSEASLAQENRNVYVIPDDAVATVYKSLDVLRLSSLVLDLECTKPLNSSAGAPYAACELGLVLPDVDHQILTLLSAGLSNNVVWNSHDSDSLWGALKVPAITEPAAEGDAPYLLKSEHGTVRCASASRCTLTLE